MYRFILSLAFTMVSFNAYAAYDQTWYRSTFWSGEYPRGFSVTKKGTKVQGRQRMDKDLAKNITCELPYLAVIQPWNTKRIAKSNVKFYARTKIEVLTAKEDFQFNTDDNKHVAIKNGDKIEFLQYDAEGSFEVRINGKQYTAGQDLYDHVTGATDKYTEDDWTILTCAGGNRAYIFLNDLMAGDDFIPGISDVGPGMTAYGQARDLTEAEAKQLEDQRGH